MSIPCRHFARGHCERGEQCGFLHVGVPAALIPDLAPGNHKTIPCRHFAKGFCQLGEACGFIHEDAEHQPSMNAGKTVPCRHFERGYCQLGEQCGFLHVPAKAVPQPSKRMNPYVSNAPDMVKMPRVETPATVWNSMGLGGTMAGYFIQQPQIIGQRSQAPQQPQPQQHHFKTQICRHFHAGGCSLGLACGFAHGEHEVGTLQPSKAPHRSGQVTLPRHVQQQLPQQQFRKTQLCRHFSNSGHCQLGDRCNFAHGEHEIGSLQPQAAPGPCSYRPEGQQYAKTKLCHHFIGGGCQQGRQCSFAHGEHELGTMQRAPAAQQQQQFKKTKLCDNFASGACTLGEVCTFAHGEHEIGTLQLSKEEVQALKQVYNSKTQLCRNFATSTCKLADLCNFAHGEHELRAPEY